MHLKVTQWGKNDLKLAKSKNLLYFTPNIFETWSQDTRECSLRFYNFTFSDFNFFGLEKSEIHYMTTIVTSLLLKYLSIGNYENTHFQLINQKL